MRAQYARRRDCADAEEWVEHEIQRPVTRRADGVRKPVHVIGITERDECICASTQRSFPSRLRSGGRDDTTGTRRTSKLHRVAAEAVAGRLTVAHTRAPLGAVTEVWDAPGRVVLEV